MIVVAIHVGHLCAGIPHRFQEYLWSKRLVPKWLTAKLGESELLHLADFVPQMVWMWTPEGKNIYFNRRWPDYTGMTLEESDGNGWNKPFHPEEQETARRAWNQAVQTGNPYQVESRLRAANGTYRWFLVRGESLKESDGRTVMILRFSSCACGWER